MLGILPILIIAAVLGVYLSRMAAPTSSNNSTFSSTSATTETSVSVIEHPFPNIEKTYDFDHIPYEFTLGNFTIHLTNNATGYITPLVNDTSTGYTGWVFAFNVTTPNGLTKYPFFLWSPPCSKGLALPCQQDNRLNLPNPENATIIYGNIADLFIVWNTNTTGLYVSFIQYEQVPNVGPAPSTYVAGSCPSYDETYPNTMTPWSAPTSNKTIDMTNLTVYWLGPASDLDGNTSQPSQNLSLKAGQVFFYIVGWSAQPFNYEIDSVYTNSSGFSVLGICWSTHVVSLPQEVIDGTNFGFTVLLQLPSNSTYAGPVNIYIQTGQKIPGCLNCNGTA